MRTDKVAIAWLNSRLLGKIWIAAAARGVARVHLGGGRAEFISLLAREGLRPASGSWAKAAARQLGQYLAGKRRRFSLRLSPPELTPFHRRIYRALEKVPYAARVTYGELAARAGSPRAARAVGRAMAQNPLPFIWPCHRVVAAGGLGGFGGGLRAKQALLDLEARAAGARRASPAR